MRKFLLCLLLLLPSLLAFAQSTPKVLSGVDSLLSKVDTIKLPRTVPIVEIPAVPLSDSLNLHLKSADSLNTIVQRNQNNVSTLASAPTEWSSKQNQRISTMQSRLTHRIDSLVRLPTPDPSKIKSLDSLRGRLDSLKNIRVASGATEKLNQSQKQVEEAVNGMEGKVNEKLALFRKNGANLPGEVKLNVATQGMNLPNSGLSLDPSMPVMNTSTASGISGAALPGINSSGVGAAPIAGVSGIGNPTNAGVPKINTPQLTGVDEIKKANSQLTQVSQASKELGSYQKDIKNISSGNLDSLDQKSIEEKVLKLDALSQANTEIGNGMQYQAMVENWNSDPMYKKEMAITLAKESATNHFAGREKELLAAMDQLSKAKSKLKDVEQVADIFAKPANPMKGKPFIERLRPGLNLQIQWRDNVFVDVNPQVGYRISGRWMVGAGWNERFTIHIGKTSVQTSDRIYGPRAYIQFKVKESNFVMLIPETMNTYVPVSPTSTSDATGRQWVAGLMAGYKREFKYSSKVLGSVQILYNLIDPHHQSPYVDRINLRIGFEFPMRKRPSPEKAEVK